MLLAQCGQSQVREAIFATKALPSLAQKLMLSAYSAEHSGHCFMGAFWIELPHCVRSDVRQTPVTSDQSFGRSRFAPRFPMNYGTMGGALTEDLVKRERRTVRLYD